MDAICPITKVDNILLATGGTEFSEGAIREAIRIAGRCSSKMRAICVVETNAEYSALAPQLVETAGQRARKHLEDVRERATQAGVECDIVVREGEDPAVSIVEEAEKMKASMIVTGRRGRKGLKRLMLGGTTARVIGHAPCNVLVVPRAAQVEFRSILMATDGSRHSMATASEAIGIAKLNHSKLTVLAVVPSEMLMPTDVDFAVAQRERISDLEMQKAEHNAKVVKDAAEKDGVSVRAFVATGKPAEVIIETAKEHDADLIVLGSHGATGIEKLLMGSVTERVIVLGTGAVLVVR